MHAIPEFGALPLTAYLDLGLRCGLVVRQQLMTDRKLFCRCPAGRVSPRYDVELVRRMRPSVNTGGEDDPAERMEFKTAKTIVYRLDNAAVCTYDMDDAPPFEINTDAVDGAVAIARRLNMRQVDELHVVRKPQLDGAIPAGFQRTVLLGVDGRLSIGNQPLRIRQIALEEETGRLLSDAGHVRTFAVDQQGTPVVEIETDTDMVSPLEVASVAEQLCRVLRETERVRTDFGSVRQAVQVSINGGARVEIRDLAWGDLIPRVVHNEAHRQAALLKLRDALRERVPNAVNWSTRTADITALVAGCAFLPIADAVQQGRRVAVVALPGFAGLLSTPTQPYTMFQQELADRVRVVACLHERPNLITTDTSADRLTAAQWRAVREHVGAGEGDACVVTWGPSDDVNVALIEIGVRAHEALQGVPAESRTVHADGSTRFHALLPTKLHLYPDTDLPAIRIDGSRAADDVADGGGAVALLARFNVNVWDDVVIHTKDGDFRGLVLPQRKSAGNQHVCIKLENGYPVGIAVARIEGMAVLGRREPFTRAAAPVHRPPSSKPRLRLFGTGGTIASRVDESTGAAAPAFSPDELYASVPELADVCNLETEALYSVYSEDMNPQHWIGIAEACAAAVRDGVDGIIVSHGTDTMQHTAAALSFMLQGSPVPIVMVGSQRSSDRPSSDAGPNLLNAARAAAESDIAEIMVCMFGPTSDDYALLHRGTRVRKMHSSYRSTFRTIGERPLAIVDRNGVRPLRTDYRRRGGSAAHVRLDARFNENVTLLYHYPGLRCDVIDALIAAGYRGIVIAGTGLGHVNKDVYPALARARDAGVAVYMTTQTLWGFTQMHVYESGRALQSLGVVPAANMLPETAFVKLGWALAQAQDPAEVRRIMLSPIAGEITDREPPDGYLIYQGGMPIIESLRDALHR